MFGSLINSTVFFFFSAINWTVWITSVMAAGMHNDDFFKIIRYILN